MSDAAAIAPKKHRAAKSSSSSDSKKPAPPAGKRAAPKHTSDAKSRGLGVRPSHKKGSLSVYGAACAISPMHGVSRASVQTILVGQGVHKMDSGTAAALRACVESCVMERLNRGMVICAGGGRALFMTSDLEMTSGHGYVDKH